MAGVRSNNEIVVKSSLTDEACNKKYDEDNVEGEIF